REGALLRRGDPGRERGDPDARRDRHDRRARDRLLPEARPRRGADARRRRLAPRSLGEPRRLLDREAQSVRLTPTQRFLRACRGEPVDRPPVWLMRQAGRYLPQYRRVRDELSFAELCRDVERAVEVSLQPIDAIGSEAVIFFSDIFTPIPGMGVDVDFRP